MRRGVWDMHLATEFGGGAEPIAGPFLTATSKDPIDVDYIRTPIEIRYGLSDRNEIGWSASFEIDQGRQIPAGNVTGTFFDASGLQEIRLFGKWKIRQRFSWKLDVAFLGNNTLTEGNDGFDFGVKFMYSPRLGDGLILLNAGVVVKSGGADFNDNNVTAAAEEYENPFIFGVGYLYPFTQRFSGIFELDAQTSSFAGGLGFKANDLARLTLGGRYSWADRVYLTSGLGLGITDGSPDLTFRLGLNWLLGAGKLVARTEEELDFWAPTEEDKQRMAAALSNPANRGSTVITPANREQEIADRIEKASEAFNRRDYVAAIAHYESAIALKDDDPVLHYNLATTYFLMRRYHEAKPYYQTAVRLNPSDIDGHLYLGYVYYYLRDPSSAEREWRKVMDLDPANVLARDNLESLKAQ